MLLSGDLMSVFFFHYVNYLININALPELFTNKAFLLYRASRHVTGAIDQEEFSAPATSTPEICGHQSNLAFQSSIST